MKMRRILATLMVAVMIVTVVSSAVMASEVSRETVQKVQQALNDAGFDCGTPDGAAGEKTKNAIEAYQQANGLEVTGEIDDDLVESLFFPTIPKEQEETITDESQTESGTVSTEPETEIYEINANGKYDGTTDEGNFFKWYSCTKIIFYVEDDLMYEIGAYNGELVFGKLNDDMSFDTSTISYLSLDPEVLKHYAQLAYEVFGDLVLFEKYFESNYVEKESTKPDAEYIEFDTSGGTHLRWNNFNKLVYVYNADNVYQFSLLQGDLVFGKLNEDGETFKWYTSLTELETFPEIMDSALELIILESLVRSSEEN